MKLSRRVILLIGLLLMLFIALPIGVVWSRRGKLPVSITVSPSDSSVMIDGKKSSSGKVYVSPGLHTFSVKRKLFDPVEQKVNISAAGSPNTIILLAAANSNEAKNWIQSHTKELDLRQKLSSEQANMIGEASRKKNPLIEALPFIDREYRIDYGPSQKYPDDPTAKTIIISSISPQSRQQALDWIRFKGVDPSSLEIVYKQINGFN